MQLCAVFSALLVLSVAVSGQSTTELPITTTVEYVTTAAATTVDPGTTPTADPGTTITDPGTTVTEDPGTTITDPGTTVTVDPGTTITDPGTTLTADPGTTDPGTTITDPGTTLTADPGTTDPVTTDPGTTDPGTTDPGTTTDEPGTTTVEPVTDMKRTVIFMQKETAFGQDLFIRGGLDESVRPGCIEDATADPCAIDITTNSLGTTEHYEGYDAWRVGDLNLDWYGPETGQNTYNGVVAGGSPLAWTSNDPTEPGYQELNIYGDHYWMIDMMMNCSQTENGWFEFKAFILNGQGWEGDVTQVATCLGVEGGSTPYPSTNHLGKCGFLNVFSFQTASCTIEPF